MLSDVQNAMNIERVGVPTTIIGDTAIVGYSSNTSGTIRRAIEYYQKEKYVDVVSQIKDGTYQKMEDDEEKGPVSEKSDFLKKESESDEAMTIEVPFFKKVNLKRISLTSAAVVIGFIDGFNPCAMWVLLFLISILIGMKNKKRMWILGLAFLFTSALVYMLIMLSWIQIAVQLSTIIWIRNLIAVVALVGGFFQLKSFFQHSDSGCEVVDDKKRKTILKKIRKFTSEKSFFLALSYEFCFFAC